MESKDNSFEKTKLPVLSYSKISSFKRCAKCYKLGYIDKLPKKDKPYTLFGNFCHYILQRFHEHYLNPNELPTVDYNEIMTKCFKESIEKYNPKLTKDQVDEAFGMMKLYLNQIKDLKKDEKFPNVIAVEKKIWHQINDFVYYGFIDRLQKDEDGLFHIIDYKTTKDKKYLKDPAQILLYGYFILQENPDIKKVRTSYILLKHKMAYMTHEHDVSELIAAKDKFVEQWEELKNEKLFRATPRFDSCTICDFAEVCDEGKSILQRKKGYFGEESSW